MVASAPGWVLAGHGRAMHTISVGGVGGSGFFEERLLARHLSKICAPRAAKTTKMPNAIMLLIACAKKRMEKMTDRNWRTVWMVAKTSGPYVLTV